MGLFNSIFRTVLGQKPWLVAKILAGDDYRFWVQIMTRDEFSGPNDYASLALSYYARLLYLIGTPGGLKSPETVRFLRLMMTAVLTDMNAWRGSILESVRSSGTKFGLGDLALVSSRMDLKESHEITLNLQRMMAGKSPGVLLPMLDVELAKNATPRQHALSVIALMQGVSDLVPEDSRIRMLAAFDAFQHASEGTRFDEWDYVMGYNKLVAICVEVPDSKVQKLKEYYEMLWRTDETSSSNGDGTLQETSRPRKARASASPKPRNNQGPPKQDSYEGEASKQKASARAKRRTEQGPSKQDSNANEPNRSKALLTGAREGDAESQLGLGFDYLQLGGEGNIEQAKYWFQAAAEQGDADAQFELAKLEDTKEKRAHWYFLAAKQKHHDAEFEYAEILVASGDIENALEWYSRAAKGGHPKAERKKAKCLKSMAEKPIKGRLSKEKNKNRPAVPNSDARRNMASDDSKKIADTKQASNATRDSVRSAYNSISAWPFPTSDKK